MIGVIMEWLGITFVQDDPYGTCREHGISEGEMLDIMLTHVDVSKHYEDISGDSERTIIA